MAVGTVMMTEGPLLGVLLRVAGPITAANLAQSVQQIINAFFVGRLGSDAIAAVAASGPLFGVLLSLGSGHTHHNGCAGGLVELRCFKRGREYAVHHVAVKGSVAS
jgi:hypothetical protein